MEVKYMPCTECNSELAVCVTTIPGYRDNETFNCPVCNKQLTVSTTDIYSVKVVKFK